MENLKALIAVAFFIASLIFASPIIDTQDNKKHLSKNNNNTSIGFLSDTTQINQSQYTLQSDQKFNMAID